MLRKRHRSFSGLALLAWAPLLQAASLELSLHQGGEPVAAAVVELIAAGAAAPTPIDAVMDQINSEFVPRQLVVTRGSAVSFPNSDSTRHQVYSFSPAKRFELPLYSGTPPAPVVFESAGVVTLGCNIHDSMIGYIVVVDSDLYALSDPHGKVRFSGLPAGDYVLRVWHERIAGDAQQTTVQLPADGEVRQSLQLTLDPPPPPRGDERMRALQERFRKLKREQP